MQNTLQNYIPSEAIPYLHQLIEHDNLLIKIKSERKTRHGDYRKLPNGKHQITVVDEFGNETKRNIEISD